MEGEAERGKERVENEKHQKKTEEKIKDSKKNMCLFGNFVYAHVSL